MSLSSKATELRHAGAVAAAAEWRAATTQVDSGPRKRKRAEAEARAADIAHQAAAIAYVAALAASGAFGSIGYSGITLGVICDKIADLKPSGDADTAPSISGAIK